MRNIFLALIVAVLTGCTTLQPPIQPEVSTQFKREKTAVAFFDPVGSIHYSEDVYLVLAVAQVSSDSDYAGIWDSDSALTRVHADEFSKLGLNAAPLNGEAGIDVPREAVARQKSLMKAFHASRSKPEGGPGIAPEFKESLRAHGYANLILVSWSGYFMHIPTLGLAPRHSINNSFWVYDLRKDLPLWSGAFPVAQTVTLPKNTGKSFLEENDLAGLKSETEKLARQRYRTKTFDGKPMVSIGQAIGFQRGD
ncbi:hypothetical protein APR50_14655 [Variovorax paradoxus]|jgi:hypothetical protein|uniref:hypothetical protein n=1 Tax=Variovorax TaxID=34072 RepID=UPI0006E654F8|nr:hypothetical protein APR50_14655 [Variovorax paradoxus]KPV12067.1 hypothetical protein APR49_07810 [Variovorax paradoxus]KPV34369.1 hypothetical protein APR48_07800 [Variovorax paradoxus]KPV34768.1 hypothetical protein APR47_14895 [Variovorax paradoxus]